MMRGRYLEIAVGFFMIVAIIALTFLAIKVSGLTNIINNHVYYLTANFDNIGDLKVRAPVRMAGVKIGQVTSIKLDRNTYQATVTLAINKEENTLPVDTSASILTEGLLGANYISLTPGFSNDFLVAGKQIEETHSAIMLQNLIGHLLFNSKEPKKAETAQKL